MDLPRDAIADLPDDGSRQHETYARYGLAMYFAQVFEHGLVNAIVLVRQVNGHIADRADWDRTFDVEFRRTASDLARRVGKYGGLSERERVLLERSVIERNRLAHRYFREHVEDSISAVGMQRMLDDADDARELFIRADTISERLCEQAIEQLGIPAHARDDIIEQLRAQVRGRDGE
ncbi:MAG TPA: hypothetical protein VGH69_07290 [Mycobacterium sp.]